MHISKTVTKCMLLTSTVKTYCTPEVNKTYNTEMVFCNIGKHIFLSSNRECELYSNLLQIKTYCIFDTFIIQKPQSQFCKTRFITYLMLHKKISSIQMNFQNFYFCNCPIICVKKKRICCTMAAGNCLCINFGININLFILIKSKILSHLDTICS